MAIKNEIKSKQQQNIELNENLISLLGLLVGVEVSPTREVKRLNQIKEDLEKNVDSLSELNQKFLQTICKLQPYVNYRNKWSKLTKSIEVRTKKLNKQRLSIPENISPALHKNLSESFQCYILNLKISSYIMILRSIEISINELYDKYNPPIFNENKNTYNFVPAKIKLEWIEKNKIIRGADYRVAKSYIEGRNEAVHEVFEPSDLQIFSAIDTVISLILKMQSNEITYR